MEIGIFAKNITLLKTVENKFKLLILKDMSYLMKRRRKRLLIVILLENIFTVKNILNNMKLSIEGKSSYLGP